MRLKEFLSDNKQPAIFANEHSGIAYRYGLNE